MRRDLLSGQGAQAPGRVRKQYNPSRFTFQVTLGMTMDGEICARLGASREAELLRSNNEVLPELDKLVTK